MHPKKLSFVFNYHNIEITFWYQNMLRCYHYADLKQIFFSYCDILHLNKGWCAIEIMKKNVSHKLPENSTCKNNILLITLLNVEFHLNTHPVLIHSFVFYSYTCNTQNNASLHLFWLGMFSYKQLFNFQKIKYSFLPFDDNRNIGLYNEDYITWNLIEILRP